MDRKSIVIMALAVGLLFAWSPVVDHFFPPKPMTPAQLAAMTNHPPANAASPNSATAPAHALATAKLVAATNGLEQTASLTNDLLVLNFTSRGGGLKSIAVRKYPAVVKRVHAQRSEKPATLNDNAPEPILGLIAANDADGDYALTQTGQTMEMAKTLSNGLRITKQVTLSTNYLIDVRVRWENTSAQAGKVPVHELITGTATPIGPLDDPNSLGIDWYNGNKTEVIKQPWFVNHIGGCGLLPSNPRSIFEEGTNNVIWASANSQFFALATIPTGPAPRLVIRPVYIDPPDTDGVVSNATAALLTNGFQASFSYPETAIAAHQVLSNDYTIYAGPKEYRRLAKLQMAMNDNHLDSVMEFTKPIGYFSEMLLLSMNWLHSMGFSYGLTIIAITLIIKGLFWPLTKASTRSQKRMQYFQPQLKAIGEKYKDDPVKKNQKTMEFMKENKLSPLGSCLPTLIQIPVFLGFYWMLRAAIELRGEHFLWAQDLSQPDTIAYIAGFPINPLPLVMGATQLIQARMLPPSPGMDPGQQKMMRYMPLMFIVLFYRMSAGLTLYWTVQNLLGILQTKLTRADGGISAAPVVASKKKG